MKDEVELKSHTHRDLDGVCPAFFHGLMGPVGLSCMPNCFPSGTGLSWLPGQHSGADPEPGHGVGYSQMIQEHSVLGQFWVCDHTVRTPRPGEAAYCRQIRYVGYRVSVCLSWAVVPL